jgi:EmrB/QacA subfamily drug resistance transporter
MEETDGSQYEMTGEQYQSGVGKWVLISTILASSMAFIDGTALNVALPVIQSDLQASGSQLLWVVNGYLMMLAALILVGGALGDEFGRKRVFMFGISLFMFSSLICGMSPNIEILIAARTMEGIGGAVMIPGSLAIITTYFHESQRGQAIGTWSAVTTIVTVSGPVLGGVLSNAGLWRGVFLINLPLGVAALLILFLQVPESRSIDATGKLDLFGAALAVLGLAGITYGFISAPKRGFGDWLVIGPLAFGSFVLVGFILVEARRQHPMLPLSLFNSRIFTGTNLLTFFLYGAISVGTFFLSLNLVQVQGYNPALAGFAFLPFPVALSLLSRWSGSLADRLGARRFLIAGPFVCGLGYLLMGFAGLTQGPADYWRSFFPGVAVLGIGMGFTVAPLTSKVMGSVAEEHAGTASGVNNAVSRTASVLAIAIVGALALILFSNNLVDRSAGISMSPQARSVLLSEADRLGAADVPDQVSAALAPQVKAAIQLAFVDVFRTVLFICAGLAWVGTFLFILISRLARSNP